MRDTTGKIEDGGATPSGRLAAAEHNDVNADVVDNVTRSGQLVNASDTSQTSEATTIAALRAPAFSVDGSSTANTLILVPISGTAGHKIPSSLGPGGTDVYNRLDGSTINFKPALANTGNVTINIGQTSGTLIGSKKLLDFNGNELPAGTLQAGFRIECQYDSTADTGTGAWLFTRSSVEQSDWDETNTVDPAFIKNKPTALPPNGTAGGDLSGTYPNPTVSGLRGTNLLASTPGNGDYYAHDGFATFVLVQSPFQQAVYTPSNIAYSNGTILVVNSLNLGAVNIGDAFGVFGQANISPSFAANGSFRVFVRRATTSSAVVSMAGQTATSVVGTIETNIQIDNSTLFAGKISTSGFGQVTSAGNLTLELCVHVQGSNGNAGMRALQVMWLRKLS